MINRRNNLCLSKIYVYLYSYEYKLTILDNPMFQIFLHIHAPKQSPHARLEIYRFIGIEEI